MICFHSRGAILLEKFKPIKKYEGIYEVSNTGNVRTVEGKTTYTEHHGIRHWKQRVLKPKTDKDGYKRVSLWKDGKCKDFLVHRLVAETFKEKIPNKDIVNHLDGNPSNNNASNLEWTDYSGNLLHAYLNDLNQEAKSLVLYNPATKEIKFFYSENEASRFLNHSNGYVSDALNKGKTKFGSYKVYLPLGDK